MRAKKPGSNERLVVRVIQSVQLNCMLRTSSAKNIFLQCCVAYGKLQTIKVHNFYSIPRMDQFTEFPGEATIFFHSIAMEATGGWMWENKLGINLLSSPLRIFKEEPYTFEAFSEQGNSNRELMTSSNLPQWTFVSVYLKHIADLLTSPSNHISYMWLLLSFFRK